MSTSLPIIHHPNRNRLTDRQLERLYRIPKITASLEEFGRAHHCDLEELSDLELELESHRVKHRLAYDERPNPWLLERRQRLQQAIRARRRS